MEPHRRRLPGVIFALVCLQLAGAVAAPAASYAGSERLVANGSFEGLRGWAGHRARLSLVPRGRAGKAARVKPRRHHGRFFLYGRPRPVRATETGRSYVATAWVRSKRPGSRVCLRIREIFHGEIVRTARSCVRSSRRWRAFGAVGFRADCTGAQVGLAVISSGRVSFDVDEIKLGARGAAAPAAACTKAKSSPPPPPAQPPAPQPPPASSPPPPPPPAPGSSFLNPFPAGSLWNSSIPGGTPVDPQSGEKISYWLSQIQYPNMVLNAYGTAVAVATPDSPGYTIACTVYACPNMHQFGQVPIPAGTKADPASDGHLAVWDPVTHHEWDFWISKCPTDCASTATGGSFSTDSLSPTVPYAANAANWPLLAGIVHPEEIAAGRINHPLIFSTPNVGTGYVCPAVHTDGKNSDPRALREGTLLQLDPSVDVAALPIPSWQKTIARALQEYGMYLADGGGSLAIGAENPINRGDLWGQVGLTGNSALFSSSFPWDRMRVLAPPKPWC